MTTISSSQRPARLRLLHWLLLSFLLVIAVTVYGVASSLRVGRDSAALRDGVLEKAATGWDTKIEIAVGIVPIYLARFGLSFVDLPSEARIAFKAIRGAEVGVYRLQSSFSADSKAGLLEAADQAMGGRNFDRVAAAMKNREFVAVYVPRRMSSLQDFKISLVVLRDSQMVVVSARGNLEPLLQLLDSQMKLGPEIFAVKRHRQTDPLIALNCSMSE